MRRISKLRKIIICFTLLIFMGVYPSRAYADVIIDYITLNNHVLNGGVGNYGSNNRTYYITSSASGFSNDIIASMNSWIYTTSRVGVTTPISYVRTTNQSASIMGIYATYDSSYPNNGSNAWTYFRYSGNYVDPMTTNWSWNQIYINTYNLTTEDTATRKQGVIAHEMGHTFGLNENNLNQYTVMCQEGSGRKVHQPMSGDLNGINYLY